MQGEYKYKEKGSNATHYKVLSFDGSNKGAVGGPQNIPYWNDSSPTALATKRRVLAKASPEAIKFWKESIQKEPGRFDVSHLNEKQWQDRRNDSIGSSEASQVTGDCPFEGCTPFDLFNRKTGNEPALKPTPAEQREREDMFDYGHEAESYLRKWVKRHWPNSKILVDTNMYNDSQFPFLTANLDGMLQLPDGTWIHIEFKTANPEAKQGYGDEDNPTIPLYYRRQLIHCQHILNVWSSRIIVMFNRSDILVRTYERDLDVEMEQIKMERDFWESHVLPGIPPDLNYGPVSNVKKALRNYLGLADLSAPPVALPAECADDVRELVAVNKAMTEVNARLRSLEKVRDEKIVNLLPYMNNATAATLDNGEESYQITYKPQKARTSVDLEVLKNDYPEVYAKVVTTPQEGPRPFKVKEVRR